VECKETTVRETKGIITGKWLHF